LSACLTWAAATAAASCLRVAYAGSMGAVMGGALGPFFAKHHDDCYQGVGQGSYALARLLAGKQMRADVFIGITPGPSKVLQKAGLIKRAVPVASTRMVVIYSPKSRFADDFVAARKGEKRWYDVLREKGLRLGRTDPEIDPQGANALLTLQLAARYYHQPDLVRQVAGPLQNPRQIFAETSLMSRLEAGQIDAAIGYLSAARSHHLPTLDLPAQIDLGHPSRQKGWYARARLELKNGKTVRARPLVFYAAVLGNARQPGLARAFVHFLRTDKAQARFAQHGYGPGRGAPL
jgi:molybdate/tungstate transport system substrate-binding protein